MQRHLNKIRAVACSALFAGLAAMSQAGNWEVTLLSSNSTGTNISYTYVNGQLVRTKLADSTSATAGIATHYVPVEFTDTVSCHGSDTWQVKWIGAGAGPSTVTVRVNTNAHNETGVGSLNCGLPVIYEDWSDQNDYEQDGEAYRVLPLTNKIATVTLSGSAEVTFHYINHGYSIDGAGARWGSYVAVDDKAVQVTCDRDMTYHKGINGGVAANTVQNTEEVLGDTVAVDGGFGTWSCSPTFGRILYGVWSNPFNEWWSDSTHWSDTLFSEIENVTPNWTFTDQQMIDLSKDSSAQGILKQVKVKVTDSGGSGPARSGVYKMRVHAPAENVVIGAPYVAHAPLKLFWGPVGPNAYPVTIDQSLTISSGTSRDVTVGITGSVEGDIKLVKASFEAEVQGKWGETATVSKSTGVQFTIPAGDTAYLVGGAQWKQWNVTWDRYNAHGYDGQIFTTATAWISGDKPTVEGNLTQSDFHWELKKGAVSSEYL